MSHLVHRCPLSGTRAAHIPGAPYLRSRRGSIGVPSELVRWGDLSSEAIRSFF